MKKKLKINDYIKAFQKNRHGTWYRGVVTEVFDDLIQVYGDEDNGGLGHYEFNPQDFRITHIEKERLKFAIDYNIKDLELEKINAEQKCITVTDNLRRANSMREKYFGLK